MAAILFAGLAVSHEAHAQTPPVTDTDEVPDTTPLDEPAAVPVAPAQEPVVVADPVVAPTGPGTLRLHVIDARNQYPVIDVDIYDATSGQRVASGTSVDETTGDDALSLELAPGTYKIVRAGDSFQTWTNFATVEVDAGETTDFVIVLDERGDTFTGSGVVTRELPRGREIAGIEVSLSGGGSLMMNTQRSVPGQTPGTTTVFGLFANFGLVFDKDNHYLDIRSDLELTLLDQPAASLFATTDHLTVEALYAYNIGNPYVGPYVKGSARTTLWESWLFLESESEEIVVNRTFADGTRDSEFRGVSANQDDLRIVLAGPFAPLILQEEVGVNLKAVSVNLLLVKLNVATRLGYALRQGIMNDLFVVEGDAEGPIVELREVDDYDTHGPKVGADAQVTVTRWLFGKASAEAMYPLKDNERAGDTFTERLLWSVAATGGFRLPILTNLLEASLDYSIRLENDGYLTDDLQIDQTIMARGRVTLF